MEFNNVGRFIVSERFFRDVAPGVGVNLFRGMVVLDVRRNAWNDEREYTAIHPQFEPIKLGEMLPEYTATIFDHTGEPTWRRVAGS